MDEQLKAVVMPAMRCELFDTVCKSKGMRLDPSSGHVPRGFFGGTGTLEEIDLVIATAEPGEPLADEKYEGNAEDMFLQTQALFIRLLHRKKGRFHRNLNELLLRCWPGIGEDEMFRRTWFTNLVLCSAFKTCGKVERDVESACGEAYFNKQMTLIPNAFIILLGGKAETRCRRLKPTFTGGRADHPSRWIGSPIKSFDDVAAEFHHWLETKKRKVA